MANKPKSKALKKSAAPKELQPREIAQRDKLHARNMARMERAELEIVRTDSGAGVKVTIQPANGQDEKLFAVQMMEALGTRSVPFMNDTLDNLVRVMSPSRNVSSDQYNAAVAILAAVEPENELEATLGAQMVAANDCAMRCMRAMFATDMADHQKMYGDLSNKFARTFAAQVEALAKLRRKGEQVVKHVHVHEGGQAVVAGTINQTGGGGQSGSGGQAYGAGMLEECAALPGPDEAGNGVPIARHAERAVPDSRRPIDGSAEG
jgi:hypothetical protein